MALDFQEDSLQEVSFWGKKDDCSQFTKTKIWREFLKEEET